MREIDIVGGASSKALGDGAISLRDANVGNVGDDVSKIIDRKWGGGGLDGRKRVGCLHSLVKSGDAVVNVTESS